MVGLPVAERPSSAPSALTLFFVIPSESPSRGTCQEATLCWYDHSELTVRSLDSGTRSGMMKRPELLPGFADHFLGHEDGTEVVVDDAVGDHDSLDVKVARDLVHHI